MSQSPNSQPSYVLTDYGKKKFIDQLESQEKEKFANMTDQYLADTLDLDRNTISKIRVGKKGVKLKTIRHLFEKLKINLEEKDYKECEKQTALPPSYKDDHVPNETKTEKLKKALRELNYEDQELSFTKIVRMESAIAFLIHGESGYGQRWLVNRLSYKVPHYTDALCYPLHLKRTRHRHSIETLWEDLASMVGSTTPLPEDIVQAIYQHRQTQTVMLCFRDVDVVTKEDINQLLHKLWQPLVTMIRDANSPENEDEHSLLLFLIDNLGCKETLGIPFASQLDSSQPHTPIELKKLEAFQENEIKRWVNTQKQLFPPQLKKSNEISQIINDIIKRNKTPMNALEVICSWCDLDWYRDIETGLKL